MLDTNGHEIVAAVTSRSIDPTGRWLILTSEASDLRGKIVVLDVVAARVLAAVSAWDAAAVPSAYDARWSPEGRRVLITWEEEFRTTGVAVVTIDGGNTRASRVFCQPGAWVRLVGGSWAPDGTSVALFVNVYTVRVADGWDGRQGSLVHVVLGQTPKVIAFKAIRLAESPMDDDHVEWPQGIPLAEPRHE